MVQLYEGCGGAAPQNGGKATVENYRAGWGNIRRISRINKRGMPHLASNSGIAINQHNRLKQGTTVADCAALLVHQKRRKPGRGRTPEPEPPNRIVTYTKVSSNSLIGKTMLNTNTGPPLPRIRDRSGPAPPNKGAPRHTFPEMRTGEIRDKDKLRFFAGVGEVCLRRRQKGQVKRQKLEGKSSKAKGESERSRNPVGGWKPRGRLKIRMSGVLVVLYPV